MSTRYSADTEINLLKEDALANIERLFTLWGLQFTKVNDCEYDFLNPTRIDKHFGAVRFNMKKGIGADFANVAFDQADFNLVGKGFDRADFGFSEKKAISYGFDIIGLCQRIHKLSTYREASKRLRSDISALDKQSKVIRADLDAHIKRQERSELEVAQRIDYGKRLLEYCRPYKGTLGETYLKARGIDIKEDMPTIRFHGNLKNSETKLYYPALVFPIQHEPGGEVRGIHRVYLDHSGLRKAALGDAKVALGEVKGNGLWFGDPGDTLYIVEGPENALSLYVSGAKFVVSTINASNFPSLKIPKCVKRIYICPDPDDAGIKACQKAKRAYYLWPLSIRYPRHEYLPNGKLADFNDILLMSQKCQKTM